MHLLDFSRTAWQRFRRHLGLFLSLHLVASLLVAAVLGPLLSLLLGWLVLATGDAALTDEDILLGLLSPAGFAFAMIGLALWLTVTVFETAGMMLAVDRLTDGRKPSLARLFQGLLMRLRDLFRLALEITLRVVLFAVPFLVVGGVIFLRYLTEFDINFYLAERPPVFWKAGGAIVLVLLLMAVGLFRMSAGWFLALPLVLLGGLPAAKALAESKELLTGKRGEVMKFLLLWLLLFGALFSLSGALLQASTGLAVDLAQGSLKTLAWLAAGLIGLWSVTNLFIGLFASVTFVLAAIDAHRRLAPVPDGAVRQRLERLDARRDKGHPLAWVLGLVVVAFGIEGAVLSQQFDGFRNDARPDIVAHRGASWDAPENTIAAIEEAIVQGADWVEIDVQETRDGRVLVAHDRDLMKVGGSPLRIFDAPFEALRAVDIGSFKDPRFADERIPLLSEVLELAKGRVKLNVELKYYGQEQRFEALVADLIDSYDMADEVVIMSLSLPGVRTMKALRPDWTVGLLSSVAVGDITRLDVDFLAVNARFASRAFVERAQGRGKDVLTWTVNDPAGMSAMIGKGVDGIITDRPGLAQQVWEERKDLSVVERLLVQLASRLGSDYGEQL